MYSMPGAVNMPSTTSHSMGTMSGYPARTLQGGYTTSFPALGVTSAPGVIGHAGQLTSTYSAAPPAPTTSALGNNGPFQFHASPASAFPDYDSPSKPSGGGYGGASDLSTAHTDGYGGQYDSNPYGSPPPPSAHNVYGAAPPTNHEFNRTEVAQPSPAGAGAAKSIDQQLLEELREIRQDISQMKSQIAANYAECMEEARGASRLAGQNNQMASQRPQGAPQGYGNEQPPYGGPPHGGMPPQNMPPYGQGGSFNGSGQGGAQPPPRQASTGRPQGPPGGGGGGGFGQGGSRMPSSRAPGNPASTRGANVLPKQSHALCGCINL